MTIAEQFKAYRENNNMTQEQMAEKLNVSCTTLSQWENGVNLPDPEMLDTLSRKFGLSVEQPMRESEIGETTPTSPQKRKRPRKISIEINLIVLIVGLLVLIAGAGLIWIKGNTVEYIDAAGMLYENFFLLPIGMLSLILGIIIILVTVIKGIIDRRRRI